MRPWLLATLLCAIAACGSSETGQRGSPNEPHVVAFDGAQATEGSAKLAHGKRLTAVLGCSGCHGKELQGKRFYELYASNLTREVANYSDAQLEQMLREGAHPTGRDVWAMPSEVFQRATEN